MTPFVDGTAIALEIANAAHNAAEIMATHRKELTSSCSVAIAFTEVRSASARSRSHESRGRRERSPHNGDGRYRDADSRGDLASHARDAAYSRSGSTPPA